MLQRREGGCQRIASNCARNRAELRPNLRALGAERVLEQVIAGEELELVVLDGGAEEDEEGVEERERPQPPDDDLEVEVVVRW